MFTGINGKAPPFLTMDDGDGSQASRGVIENVSESQRSSGSNDGGYSPPPLPPGEEIIPLPRPPPSISPATPPLRSSPPLEEFDSEKYAPLSTPPSPFVTEEEYLECLLNWRLQHLAVVKKKEKEAHRRRKMLQPDGDKVRQ